MYLAGSAAFAVSFSGFIFFPFFSTTATGRSLAVGFCRPDFEEGSVTLFIYFFIYYFPTIKITQALHYTKMWRGDLRKPQGLYEEAPSLQ